MKKKNIVLIMIWLSFLVSYFDRTNIALAMPFLAKDLNLTAGQMGMVFSAFSIGYLLIMLPAGVLTDKWGPKIVLILSITLWSIFTGLTGMAIGLGILIVVRVLFGMSEGLGIPAAYKEIIIWFNKDEQTKASSSYLTASTIGPILVAPIVATIVQTFDWRIVFYISAIPGLVVAVLMYFFLPKGKSSEDDKHLETTAKDEDSHVTMKPFLTNSSFWALYGMHFGINVVFWGILSWLPTYLMQYKGIDIKSSVVLAMTPYIGGFIALMIGARFGDKMLFAHKKYLLAIGHAIGVASLYWVYSTSSMIQVGICLAIVGFIVYLQTSLYFGIVGTMAPTHLAGTIIGLLNSAASISGFVAPVLIGILVGATHSFAAGFGIMIIGLVIACVGILIVKPINVKSASQINSQINSHINSQINSKS